MSHHIFKEVLRNLSAEQGYRDKVKAGTVDLHEEGLNGNEIFVLFLCGVYAGHLDLITGQAISPRPETPYDRFRKVLNKLSTDTKYRTKVKIGAINLEKDESLTHPQISVLYEAGVHCGHL